MSPRAKNPKKEEITKATSSPTLKESAAIQNEKKKTFYIVGMGGSAGSLEAFEEFFRNMPADSGLAFVLVPHLDPTHKGMMPELLQRTTTMKVIQVKDGMKVQPNHVYVIPPAKDMSMLHGSLQLLDPSKPRGMRMPIDFFFRQLAEDQGEMSISIILSGMGTDGTLGLKAIKGKLGMSMVQDVASAKYNGMPESAINTGMVDYIAPANELPVKLLGYLNQLNKVIKKLPLEKKEAPGAMQKVFALIRVQTGNDFSLYKRSTVHRRIERRMSVHKLNNINQYVRFLQENPHEIDCSSKSF
jgi:chemotaxis response regulator CheB